MGAQYLFVYGTLRAGSRAPQAAHLAREARYIGTGHVAGTLLRVAHYPGLVDGEGQVTGDLYVLRTPDLTLSWLDRYEGENFQRRVTPVRLAGLRECRAWVYWYRGAGTGRPVIGSGDFLGPD